jgi:hypothetical protein
MEDFLKKLGYEIKLEHEVDGVVASGGVKHEEGLYRQVEKRKYASKEGGPNTRLESAFWQELKKKLLNL